MAKVVPSTATGDVNVYTNEDALYNLSSERRFQSELATMSHRGEGIASDQPGGGGGGEGTHHHLDSMPNQVADLSGLENDT